MWKQFLKRPSWPRIRGGRYHIRFWAVDDEGVKIPGSERHQEEPWPAMIAKALIQGRRYACARLGTRSGFG